MVAESEQACVGGDKRLVRVRSTHLERNCMVIGAGIVGEFPGLLHYPLHSYVGDRSIYSQSKQTSVGAPELFLLSAGIGASVLQASAVARIWYGLEVYRLYTEDQTGCYLKLEVVEILRDDCKRGGIQMGELLTP